MGREYVSKLRPPTGLLLIPKIKYMSIDSHGGMILTGEREELGEKPVPVQVCPPQTHMD
jgi:hypothetical protein